MLKGGDLQLELDPGAMDDDWLFSPLPLFCFTFTSCAVINNPNIAICSSMCTMTVIKNARVEECQLMRRMHTEVLIWLYSCYIRLNSQP